MRQLEVAICDFAALEKRLDSHDESIAALFEAIRRLLEPVESEMPRREIGFHIKNRQRLTG